MRVDPTGVDRLGVEMNRIVSEVGRQNIESQRETPSERIEDFITDFKENIKKFRDVVRGELQFEIDRDTNMIIVKIKDKETGDVIRQIPPDVVVKLAKAMEEFLGVILDERV